MDGDIRITVSGTGVTWGAIKAAVELIGKNPNDPLSVSSFTMTVSNANALFAPQDEKIIAPLSGGKDATGLESTLARNPQYQGYHPIADPMTNPEPLPLFTNGAGYTVSYGRDVSEYGYAHGVVNAALAVELAKQWHLKDQNLPAEKTYLQTRHGTIRLRTAEETNEESGEFLIPGALTFADEGFAEYFNEFFKEPSITAGMEAQMGPPAVPATPDVIDAMSLPFHEDDPPVNTRGTFDVFDVPAIDPVTGASNVMSMEWAEVHVTITGDANALNYVKMTLVSPDGTNSELLQNHYNPDDINLSFQNIATRGTFVGFSDSITPMDDGGGNSDTLDFVFSTNRIWGERSDSRPVFDEYGNLIDFKGWELHYENYSGSDLEVSDVQIAFHGSPVGSSAGLVERVMGKVGIDSGRFIQQIDQVVGADDGAFNFDRYITTLDSDSNNFYNVGSTTPFGLNETRIVDTTQELFAGNITVYAIDNDTGLRVAQFLTGYDGNYYFDLPEGEYTIGIEDPLGRDVLDNDTGHRNYDNEWVVTIDTTDDYFRTAGAIDPVSGKFHLFDNLNFLLDPGVGSRWRSRFHWPGDCRLGRGWDDRRRGYRHLQPYRVCRFESHRQIRSRRAIRSHRRRWQLRTTRANGYAQYVFDWRRCARRVDRDRACVRI